MQFSCTAWSPLVILSVREIGYNPWQMLLPQASHWRSFKFVSLFTEPNHYVGESCNRIYDQMQRDCRLWSLSSPLPVTLDLCSSGILSDHSNSFFPSLVVCPSPILFIVCIESRAYSRQHNIISESLECLPEIVIRIAKLPNLYRILSYAGSSSLFLMFTQ